MAPVDCSMTPKAEISQWLCSRLELPANSKVTVELEANVPISPLKSEVAYWMPGGKSCLTEMRRTACISEVLSK